ncbi:acyl-CoA dehydrogenase family protein [Streptomyces acidiscabies]|uniref:Acyl-CoA/acyl-ACP dehydrogenase n=1 Tax=Streptomyces acidiscabies TaxID=42234 RepID=A0AAP6BA95_9ACTN|nr:acyl-CoA dehydrogenase family protein [Streptomyces acidiscabies]MBP5935548.1 acyl-CoA dehydrogenase [Streptomyces sp. LBUM 1476]MBZ3916574.1 acyl-CoA/acyl-ACP dehydrogenase [Streptomyces acidiscabies]MDX2961051.1 acyl-CoA/acyl-ACP dehydrogenase [Streptomyces acidiscabies]MDX3020252.1 acyl-CoA/acyl-ACP dehydrogenase [Streptomyces acidiscabies]MDX3791758.1 acyl-CoA/acyl-ACP dehydrogenase [Streptomyces acidiscabies]
MTTQIHDLSGDAIGELVGERWGGLLEEIGAGAAERYAAGEAFPRSFLARAAQAGLHRLSMPKDVGGEGLGSNVWGRVLEEMTHRCDEAAFPLVVSMSTSIAFTLHQSGDAALTENYVRPLVSGELTATLGFTEDADFWSWETELTRDGECGVLSGRKSYLTGGLLSHVFLVYAGSGQGRLAACLVHHDDPGVTVTPANGIGLQSAGMAVLDLAEVRLGQERILTWTDGLDHSQLYLNERRSMQAAWTVGRMRALVDRCAARLRTATRQGRPVLDYPNVAAGLGRMHIVTDAARTMTHDVLDRQARGETDLTYDAKISAAKHFSAEQSMLIAHEALRVLGGHAFYGDEFYGRYLRDCAGLIPAGGTQHSLEITIGNMVAKHLI